ncbi:hypothetical protein LOK49_LG15G00924 [Camellia lanceoleosa]|uniref:Uncharacterized protein n=1 Tax=Camellia lanceoleosa TaxID=1840588 RepID=A0ACC0F1Q5_9ERIC|nr:hypothetical protein LOK49_LG15G00924 [Camellia lanceoleosa]
MTEMGRKILGYYQVTGSLPFLYKYVHSKTLVLYCIYPPRSFRVHRSKALRSVATRNNGCSFDYQEDCEEACEAVQEDPKRLEDFCEAKLAQAQGY